MLKNYAISTQEKQEVEPIHAQLGQYLQPLVAELSKKLDLRLVRTLLASIALLLHSANAPDGLLLSQLGGRLLGPKHAPAGAKRLGNLLRCTLWSAEVIERFLFDLTQPFLDEMVSKGETIFALWDDTVLEYPESLAAEGMCPVRSSKVTRLKRVKPGYYNPPGGRPVFVPGLHGTGVLLTGFKHAPVLAAISWWTTRGKQAMSSLEVHRDLLRDCTQQWGRQVIHVFDRGFAGQNWLKNLAEHQARFIVRWVNTYKLIDSSGQELKASAISRHYRSWQRRQVWDRQRQRVQELGVVAVPVRHHAYEGQLSLVICRGGGPQAWYLLTSEEINTPEQAWQIVFGYIRRWQIEVAWRYNKSALGMQSPRLHLWENRLKMLGLITLAYAFLLTLVRPTQKEQISFFMQKWAHRTGKWRITVDAPLYLLKEALFHFWCWVHPDLYSFAKNFSG